MPRKPPHICGCGQRVASGETCTCKVAENRDRKARHDARRASSSQRGYNGTWDRERAKFLKRNPFCRMCGAPAVAVDHIVPHKGDQELFWDRTNWQPLCATHHNSTKQRLERRQAKGL